VVTQVKHSFVQTAQLDPFKYFPGAQVLHTALLGPLEQVAHFAVSQSLHLLSNVFPYSPAAHIGLQDPFGLDPFFK